MLSDKFRKRLLRFQRKTLASDYLPSSENNQLNRIRGDFGENAIGRGHDGKGLSAGTQKFLHLVLKLPALRFKFFFFFREGRYLGRKGLLLGFHLGPGIL